MLGYAEKENDFCKIDYVNLKENINILKLQKSNEIYKYVISLFDEYNVFLQKNDKIVKTVIENLKSNLAIKLIDCTNNIDLIKNSKIVLSSSHENTYYILKILNKSQNKKVLVICLDMHSDTYNYNDSLWKGNTFSKLLKEKYIDDLLVIGVPNGKIEQTKLEIQNDIKSKVNIINEIDIEKYLIEIKPTNVFISIDIDCLNTRNAKLTALEYCPATILSSISNLRTNNINSSELEKYVKNCVFIKNDLGYANLYHIGENKMNFLQLKAIIATIKQLCSKYNIILGFNYKNHIVGDITEIKGYDYGNLTSEMVMKLINELI